MKKEEVKCRGPMAAAFNKIGVWLPFPNISYAIGYSDMYDGRPDGEYRTRDGYVCDVEFKAFAGSMYFGDPVTKGDSTGWHKNQRDWWKYIGCERSCVPYYLVIWAYPEFSPSYRPQTRFAAKKEMFFVVEPPTFLHLESTVAAIEPENPKRTIAVGYEKERIKKYRHLSLESCWANYLFRTAADAAAYIDAQCRQRKTL